MVSIKTFVIVIAAIVLLVGGAGWFGYNYMSRRNNDLIDQIQKDYDEQKKDLKVREDSLKTEFENELETIKLKNDAAIKESEYWYQQARKKSINPDYDIDFLNAASIITKSNYKPGE